MSSLSTEGCKHRLAPVIIWGVREGLEFSNLHLLVLPTRVMKCLQYSRHRFRCWWNKTDSRATF